MESYLEVMGPGRSGGNAEGEPGNVVFRGGERVWTVHSEQREELSNDLWLDCGEGVEKNSRTRRLKDRQGSDREVWVSQVKDLGLCSKSSRERGVGTWVA